MDSEASFIRHWSALSAHINPDRRMGRKNVGFDFPMSMTSDCAVSAFLSLMNCFLHKQFCHLNMHVDLQLTRHNTGLEAVH